MLIMIEGERCTNEYRTLKFSLTFVRDLPILTQGTSFYFTKISPANFFKRCRELSGDLPPLVTTLLLKFLSTSLSRTAPKVYFQIRNLL